MMLKSLTCPRKWIFRTQIGRTGNALRTRRAIQDRTPKPSWIVLKSFVCNLDWDYFILEQLSVKISLPYRFNYPTKDSVLLLVTIDCTLSCTKLSLLTIDCQKPYRRRINQFWTWHQLQKQSPKYLIISCKLTGDWSGACTILVIMWAILLSYRVENGDSNDRPLFLFWVSSQFHAPGLSASDNWQSLTAMKMRLDACIWFSAFDASRAVVWAFLDAPSSHLCDAAKVSNDQWTLLFCPSKQKFWEHFW